MTDFEDIYNLYFRDVYKLVLSLGCDKEVAEDITQETFFKSLKNIDKFKSECSLRVWLCQIAKNTYFSFLLKNKRLDFTQQLEEKPSSVSIENELLDKESANEVYKLLHLMEEPYKEVFTLRVFAELPFSQIAQLFGKTESWARVTYHRAKLKLKEGLS